MTPFKQTYLIHNIKSTPLILYQPETFLHLHLRHCRAGSEYFLIGRLEYEFKYVEYEYRYVEYDYIVT